MVCPNSDPIFVLKLVFSKLGKLELILCIFQSLDSTVAEISIGVPNFFGGFPSADPGQFQS